MKDRYDASGSSEGQFESGSNGLVLANKRGIVSTDVLEDIEFQALLLLQATLFDEIEFDRRITANDLRDWHERWLGDLFEWAGNYRNVNMSKGNFQFAVAHQVHKLMNDFDKTCLATFTPCNNLTANELIHALAKTHVEFILIHPFRDGNGRLGRLLMTVMALQAGKPILDFTCIEENKDSYIMAIQAGMDMNYKYMEEIISNVFDSSRE